MKQLFIIYILLHLFHRAQSNAEIITNKSQLTGHSCVSELEKDTFNELFAIQDLIQASSEQCIFENPVNKVYLALSFLKKGTFRQTFKSKDQIYFNEFPDNDSVFEYLINRIKIIKIENCHTPTIAYVFRQQRFFNEVHICADTLTKLSISPSTLASTLIHEARHIDKDDEAHFTCTQGLEKGREGTCDKSREQKGGYHYGTEYAVKVAKFGENFHPAIYASLRADAFLKLLNRFNKIPTMNSPEYALLREEKTNNLQLIQQNFKISDLNIKINGQIYDRRLNSALVVNSPTDKNLFGFDLYNGQQMNVGLYANQINSLKIKPEIIDIFFGGYKYLANAMTTDKKNIHYEFKSASGTVISSGVLDITMTGEFDRFLQPENCDADLSSLYFTNKNSDVFKLSPENKNKIIVQKQNSSSCEYHLISKTNLNNKTVQLTNRNELQFLNTDSAEMNLITDKKYDFLSASFNIFDFFRIDK